MNRFLNCGLLTVTALLLVGGPTIAATKTVIQTKGADATASFDVEEVESCVGGSTALLRTSVGVQMFETSVKTGGTTTTALQTLVQVSRFDGCTFNFSFGAGSFQGGTLPMTALQTATVKGHFPLDDGTIVDLNLKLTGSDTTSLGTNMSRSILGKVMVIQRFIGTTRTATISGTATIDGHGISMATVASPTAQLARNTGGEITIVKP